VQQGWKIQDCIFPGSCHRHGLGLMCFHKLCPWIVEPPIIKEVLDNAPHDDHTLYISWATRIYLNKTS
jgi:hypothetical protein